MLGKLLKYEFKATGRILLPLYGAMVLVGLITSFFINENSFGASQAIFTMMYIGICIVSVVITFLLVIQRFSKNLLSDEGYLMFTLPVSTSSLIISKLIVAVCWGIVGTIAGIISGIALFATVIPWSNIPEMLHYIFTHLGSINSRDWLLMFETMIGCIFSYALFVMAIYTSLSVGQLPFAGKHRKVASIGAFFIIYVIYVTVVSVTGTSLALNAPRSWLLSLPVTAQFGIAMGVQLVVIAILFLLTRFFLKKHLNLE